MRCTLFILSLSLFTTGCSLLPGGNNEEPVARVFEEYLYPADLTEAIPEGTPTGDSTFLAKRYIENWVKERLLMQRAEISLSDEQKEFDKQIEEYHRSLLIFTYRQKLLQQKLDTVITGEEIQAYYDENQANFSLSHNVIKGTYVKVPLEAPRLDQVRRWSWNNREEDLDQLEKYCLNHARKYSDFNETWVNFQTIGPQLPMRISRPSAYLASRKNIETTDTAYRYFLHVSDHLPEGSVTPIEMVSEDIVSILLNKRRIEFIQDLEQRVYSDGINRNQFEIYQ